MARMMTPEEGYKEAQMVIRETLEETATYLDLGLLGLTAIPPEITQLTTLQTLDLGYNELTFVPPEIAQLTALKMLSLNGNPLPTIPEWLVQLPQLKILLVKDTPVTQPPPELLGQALTTYNEPVDLEAIRRYYTQLKKEGEAYFYEAKLLIIGAGGAGKTSLARKLLNSAAPLPQPHESTEGIDVKSWQFPISADLTGSKQLEVALNLSGLSGTQYTANIWDFGGQSVYKATHQFFFTSRSVYILLNDTRRNETDFYDWLYMQEVFGDDSPVLLLQNQNRSHGNQCDIENLPYLRDRFPNLKETVELDISGVPDKETIAWEDLQRYLQRHLMALNHIGSPVPTTWVAVRNALATEKATGTNSISRRAYFALCAEQGISDKEDTLQLSRFLHDIGDLLHFQNNATLANLVILDTTWALDAVYRVLDNQAIQRNWGRFSNQQLHDLWHEKEYDNHHHQLLALMIHFNLCYKLPDQDERYIAPQLLQTEVPDLCGYENLDGLELRFHYDRFMPRGILSRAIAALHPRIQHADDGQPLIWRSGAILTNGEAHAKLLELHGEMEIRIQVSGQHRRDFLMEIVRMLDTLHKGFSSKLQYDKLVTCRCDRCQQIQRDKSNKEPIHFFKLNYLRKRLASPKQSKHIVECTYEPFDDVHVRDLIDDSILHMDRRDGTVYNISGNYIEGDDIDVGDMHNVEGAAIGREASATVNK